MTPPTDQAPVRGQGAGSEFGPPPDGALPVAFCAKCKKPHRVGLRCWRGRYASAITASVLAEQGTICWVCGGRATTADHVVARYLGGGDDMGNLRPCCVSCNSRRYHRANPFDPDRDIEAPAPSLRWRT